MAAAITLHLTCHTGSQLAHALRPHPHEGTGCDLGQWRRWGEATPALGVLEALFRILPRRCRPTLARVGLQGGARAHQEQPVDGAQGRSASGCPTWAHRAMGRSYHASRNRLIRAVTVTVTFRGSNITGRGSNCPVTATPDPARPGGVGEHQRRAALKPPASSRPPNIGQMRVLNQVLATGDGAGAGMENGLSLQVVRTPTDDLTSRIVSQSLGVRAPGVLAS